LSLLGILLLDQSLLGCFLAWLHSGTGFLDLSLRIFALIQLLEHTLAVDFREFVPLTALIEHDVLIV